MLTGAVVIKKVPGSKAEMSSESFTPPAQHDGLPELVYMPCSTVQPKANQTATEHSWIYNLPPDCPCLNPFTCLVKWELISLFNWVLYNRFTCQMLYGDPLAPIKHVSAELFIAGQVWYNWPKGQYHYVKIYFQHDLTPSLCFIIVTFLFLLSNISKKWHCN